MKKKANRWGFVAIAVVIIIMCLCSNICILHCFIREGYTNEPVYFNVYYINIERRTDRREHFLSEIRKLEIPDTRIIRVHAIEHKIGTLGCLQSHIKALKTALNDEYSCALICEDDFTFKHNTAEVREILQNAVQKCKIEWNVILFAINGTSVPTECSFLNKVNDSQTASGYLIKKTYIPTLLSLWEELYDRTKHYDTLPSREEHCDIAWKKLQHDKWYVTNPVLGYQYASYSDIQKGFIDSGV